MVKFVFLFKMADSGSDVRFFNI